MGREVSCTLRQLRTTLPHPITHPNRQQLTLPPPQDCFQLSYEFGLVTRPAVDTQAALMVLVQVLEGGPVKLASPSLGTTAAASLHR
jgi:hypothetical protein